MSTHYFEEAHTHAGAASEALAHSAPRPRRKARDVAFEQRAMRERRGRGHDERYSGWIQVTRSDFPSHGVSHIIPILQGRQQDTLSTLERTLLLLLNYWGAREVREQKPLALDANDQLASAQDLMENIGAPGSLDITESRGWKHPVLTNGTPKRLTTDVLAEDGIGNGHAFYVRYGSDLPAKGSRQWQLLEIQREYWCARSMSFSVFTEDHVDASLEAHLIWAFDGVGTVRWAGDEFMKFLGAANFDQPLLNVMRSWPEGPEMGIARFKSALIAGVLEIREAGKRPALLTRAWNVGLVTESAAARLARFVRNLEVRA